MIKLREAVVILASGLALVIGLALSDGTDRPTRPTLPRYRAPLADPVSERAYEWSVVPIGAGGFVTGVVSGSGDRGSITYARTDVGGAYRWHEDTRTWEQMLRTDRVTAGALEESDYSVASIAVGADPSVVAMAVGSDFDPSPAEVEAGLDVSRTGRVLVSTDGGGSWTPSEHRWFVAGNQHFRAGSERLAIDPTNPDRLHFGTQREGLWTSEDSGATWSQVAEADLPFGQDGAPTEQQPGISLVSFAPAIEGDEPVLIAGVTASGIYRSADRGQSWDLVVALGPEEIPVSPTPVGDGMLVTIHTPGRDEARLLRLEGGATEVVELNVPTAVSQLITAADPADPEHLVAADEAVRSDRFWTSTDGGESWRSHRIGIEAPTIPWLAFSDLTDHMSTGRLMFDPDVAGRLWFAEGMGMWHTDDVEAERVVWTAASTGIEETVVTGFLVPPDGATFVTVADRQGFRFDDLDHHPNQTLIDPRFASGADIDHSGQHPEAMAWVGAESNLTPDEARPRGAVSLDGGTTWDEMGGLGRSMYGGEVAVSATDPSNIVWLPTHPALSGHAENRLGLYTSSSGGRRWNHVSPDGEFDSFHRYFWWHTRRALAADRVDGRFYLMADEERLYTSTDGGSSWERARHSPPCTTRFDCHVFGQVRAEPDRAGHLWASTGTGGLWRSADAGASEWERVTGIDEARSFSFGAPIGDAERPTVFLHGRVHGDEHLGVWRSTDDGQTWVLLSHGPNAMAATINTIAGDPNVPGRVLVGFAGAGAVVGDDPTLG